MNAQKKKPVPSIARAIPLPKIIRRRDWPNGPHPDVWWFIVIGMNLPTFLTGLTILKYNLNIIAFIVAMPMLVTPVWNIRLVLARRRGQKVKPRWPALLILLNVYIGICGVLYLVLRPGRVSGLPATMIVSAAAGINMARWAKAKDV